MADPTLMSAMRAYRTAHRLLSAMKQTHDKLVEQQRDLLTSINHAEANTNKAREEMLRVIEQTGK